MGRIDVLKYVEGKGVNISDVLPYSFMSNHADTIDFALDNSILVENNRWSYIIDECLILISKCKNEPQFKPIVTKIGCKFNWFTQNNVFPYRLIQYGFTEIFIDIIRYWYKSIASRIQYFCYASQYLLYYACACNQYDIAEFLLRECNNQTELLSNGETSLIRCAKDGKIELVQLLLDYNAKLTTESNSGEIALHSAVRNNQFKVIPLLLQNDKENQLNYTVKGMNSLHIAAAKLNLESIQCLLDFGVDVNSKNPKTKHTALHYACTMNSEKDTNLRISVIDLLVDRGADITLKCATILGDLGVVELACVSPIIVGHLIARGAPEVSIEEINRKREEARKRLGKILIFEDNMSEIEDKVLNHPQEFLTENIQAMQEENRNEIQKLNNTTNKIDFTIKPWKTIRLFLSSTFIDMQSERELLIKRIIPSVKEQCAKKKIHLIDIDLRWGVTEAEVQTGKALEVCLREAKQSDIFCGLLGSRYGWVPSNIPYEIQNAYQWKEGYSITHMEIQEGVMRRFIPNTNTLDGCSAFFCIRDEAATQKISSKYLDDFFESDSNKKKSLEILKKDIQSKNLPIINYSPSLEYGSNFPKFSSLENFGREFEKQLLKSINNICDSNEIDNSNNKDSNMEYDPIMLERQFHQTFIEMRSSSFLGRSSIINKISDEIKSSYSSENIIVVSGGAGSGKSSLMAKIVSNFTKDNSPHDLFVLGHFIGGSPSSISIRNTLNRLCEEINQEYEFSEKIENDYDELVKQFKNLLIKVSTKGHKKNGYFY